MSAARAEQLRGDGFCETFLALPDAAFLPAGFPNRHRSGDSRRRSGRFEIALDELDIQFEKQTGKKIDISYGSSGNFFAQIENGAPFDVLLSADIEYPGNWSPRSRRAGNLL